MICGNKNGVIPDCELLPEGELRGQDGDEMVAKSLEYLTGR